MVIGPTSDDRLTRPCDDAHDAHDDEAHHVGGLFERAAQRVADGPRVLHVGLGRGGDPVRACA